MPARASDYQLVVAGLSGLGGVAEVGEQGKEQIRVAVAQIADLQGLQKMLGTSSARPSRVGTTTMVRWASGIPSEKSRRGSTRGGTTSVTSRLMMGKIMAEAARRPTMVKKTYHPQPWSGATM